MTSKLILISAIVLSSVTAQAAPASPATTTNSNAYVAADSQSVLERQAANGDVDAQIRLAALLERGSEQDLTRAAAFYLAAGKSGSAAARTSYVSLVISHPSMKDADYKTAFGWLEPVAQTGDATAENNLGEMYLTGQGVRASCYQALSWFEKAAKQGVPAAEFNLANMYANGRGVDEIDNVKAFAWYKKAADQGFAPAQNELGNAYLDGAGVTADNTIAIAWYRKAADQGFAAAENNMGVMYSQGKGVVADATEAARWYRMAAANGSLAAQNSLGVLFASGRGVEQDIPQAEKLFRAAADHGYPTAQMNLGMMYIKGIGVQQDYAKGYFWLMLAKAFGENVSRDTLEALEARLDSGTRAQTETEWQSWFKAHYRVL